ncbi:MAG TPA: alpha-1,4-glucan--maltose-1-phosphate maltosyltransferase [Bryobacteraceae bacterium]|nr:alpha-1,4-glucan--maltose-1-phosphate maltosyltransferase [Bryobacteraceae bacterium]
MKTLHLDGRQRAMIESVSPEVDCGRFPAKRVVGDTVRVEADIFADGHDSISAVLLYRHEVESEWQEAPFEALVNDRWVSEFRVSRIGRYRYTIHAWIDHFETWRRDLLKRIQAGQDSAIDYQIGAILVAAAATRAPEDKSFWLSQAADLLGSARELEAKRNVATDEKLKIAMAQAPDRSLAASLDRELEIVVDPPHARFSAWYEFFPRSTSPVPGAHATLTDALKRLDYAAELGFDVVYLSPIHPIGTQFRKGKNNSTVAAPGDVGSPWAIGAAEGGHKSIHPSLGTIDDFCAFVNRASELGIRTALDVAFQVSPDHPYVAEHQDWFIKRPDGTVQYAENPPKKYQDIYPFNFESSSWRDLWEDLKSIFDYWIEQGVSIFRVDNPHTKSFPFWEWAISDIKKRHPETIFLAEAFTRPKIMYRLAKLGFSQSYTYFPWRNTKAEITGYLTELTKPPVREFFRPSQWPNTPDILTEFLQTGGRAAFLIRFILAATLGANYGIYGPAFELLEARPLRPGSEEYLDSEKYQIRAWDLNSGDSLRDLIAIVNRARRDNPALQNDWTLDFHRIDNDQLVCYTKQSFDGANLVLVVVNLDPHYKQSGFVDLPLDKLKIDPSRPFQAHDLLTGARYLWNGPRNYVELNPASIPGHLFVIRRHIRSEVDFDYFL